MSNKQEALQFYIFDLATTQMRERERNTEGHPCAWLRTEFKHCLVSLLGSTKSREITKEIFMTMIRSSAARQSESGCSLLLFPAEGNGLTEAVKM